MALKRLDEEFELKPGTQLLPYMKRLLPSLEGRFQAIEDDQDIIAKVGEDIRAAALLRMNEILIPATEDIIEVTKLGFLLAPIDGLFTLALGDMTFPIKPGAQQDTFTPSPYLIIEHTADDYAIARLESYEQELGILEVTITALHGNPGPWDDWVVSSTPGMADSAKLYHDAIAPMHTEIVADYADILVKYDEIVNAANDLEAAGLDLYNYVRIDGTTPFTGVQGGVHPNINSNDVSFATTAWTRARMNEYLMGSMSSSGAAMTGPLYLHANPTQPLMAATKAYVDAVLGAGGQMNASLTIVASNPYLKLKSTGLNEYRTIEAISSDGLTRWAMAMADNAPASGGNAGANWYLARYNDAGALLDYPISIARATAGVVLTGPLSTPGAGSFGGNLSVGGTTNLQAATAASPAVDNNSASVPNTNWVRTFVASYAQPKDPNLFAGIPIIGAAGYTTTAADSQKCMAGTGVVYINSAVHPVGAVLTFAGYGGPLTIVCSGNAMYWISPSGLTSGNRVLPDRGIGTAIRTQDGNWIIAGNGMT